MAPEQRFLRRIDRDVGAAGRERKPAPPVRTRGSARRTRPEGARGPASSGSDERRGIRGSPWVVLVPRASAWGLGLAGPGNKHGGQQAWIDRPCCHVLAQARLRVPRVQRARLLAPLLESRAPYPSTARPGRSAHVGRHGSISGWRDREHREVKSCRPGCAETAAVCPTPSTAADYVSAQGSTSAAPVASKSAGLSVTIDMPCTMAVVERGKATARCREDGEGWGRSGKMGGAEVRRGRPEEYVLGEPGEYAGRADADVRAVHALEKGPGAASVATRVFARRCAGYAVKPEAAALGEGIRTAGGTNPDDTRRDVAARGRPVGDPGRMVGGLVHHGGPGAVHARAGVPPGRRRARAGPERGGEKGAMKIPGPARRGWTDVLECVDEVFRTREGKRGWARTAGRCWRCAGTGTGSRPTLPADRGGRWPRRRRRGRR